METTREIIWGMIFEALSSSDNPHLVFNMMTRWSVANLLILGF